MALVLGDSELEAGEVAWKPLRDSDGRQRSIPLEQLGEALKTIVSADNVTI